MRQDAWRAKCHGPGMSGECDPSSVCCCGDARAARTSNCTQSHNGGRSGRRTLRFWTRLRQHTCERSPCVCVCCAGTRARLDLRRCVLSWSRECCRNMKPREPGTGAPTSCMLPRGRQYPFINWFGTHLLHRPTDRDEMTRVEAEVTASVSGFTQVSNRSTQSHGCVHTLMLPTQPA